jgi:hypothetical protein
MAEGVYFLCAVTAVVCATLLFRNYRRTRLRLLLWSSACFIALAATNVLLFVDLVVVPERDLSLYRTSITLIGLLLLLYGLITES